MRKVLLLVSAFFSFLSLSAFNYSSEQECLQNNYVSAWGKLRLVGNQLSSESGEPVQLRGWSTHGHQWSGYKCFDDKNDFEGQKKFGANIARIAMYVQEGGYENFEWVKDCLKWTSELGMYCMIDWHVLNPGQPTKYLSGGGLGTDAAGFFKNLSNHVKEKNYKHVIYEICNEPNENTEGDIYRPELWKDIKKYADAVLKEIAQNDPSAVVVVGTPQWDQALVHPLEDPLDNDYGLNVMYAFHYYACSHEMYLGGLQAAAGSLPVFVTEWGTTEHKGQTGICRDAANKMIDVCNGLNLGGQKISWCNWSWSTEGGESRSLTEADNYSYDKFSNSGKYIVELLRKGDVSPSVSGNSEPYGSEPIKISANEVSVLKVEQYDRGGEGISYHDYDASWIFDISPNCNAGVGTGNMASDYRPGDCVDVSYMVKGNTSNCNIGYIVSGEWLKYTVNVETPGYYKLRPYANAHTGLNVMTITVDGKSIVRDLNNKQSDRIRAVKMKVNGPGDKSGGYGDWDTTFFYSNYDGKNMEETEYGVYFEKAGVQTLAISFMTECSGLGDIYFIPENFESTSVDGGVPSVEAVEIYPNPSVDGNFMVNSIGQARVEVMDITGNLLYQTDVIGLSVIKSGLSSGMYIVRIETESKVVVKKLVVR